MTTTSTATRLRDDKHRDPKENTHRCRILVIDDVPDAADSMRMLLEMFGHDVRAAYTGTGAIELARQFCPEVVLCDIGMPIVCGFDVARALREDQATTGAWLIATTGFISDAIEQKCRAAGFDRHMAKPIDVDELRDLLAAWTDKSLARSIAAVTQ
jgi:CheY-like chemotaxis protein